MNNPQFSPQTTPFNDIWHWPLRSLRQLKLSTLMFIMVAASSCFAVAYYQRQFRAQQMIINSLRSDLKRADQRLSRAHFDHEQKLYSRLNEQSLRLFEELLKCRKELEQLKKATAAKGQIGDSPDQP